MIDLLTVFHRGGAVLYTRSLTPVADAPVDALIGNVLLEERTGASSYRHGDKYTVKWTFANELDLVFVAVYLNLANLLYMDELLAAVKDKFTSMFRDAVLAVEPPAAYKKFNRVVEELVSRYEMPGGMTVATPGVEGAPHVPAEKKPQHSHAPKKKQPQVTSGKDGADGSEQQQQESTQAASASPTASSGNAGSGVNMEKLLAMQQAARTGKPTLNIKKKVKAPTAGADAAADGAAAPKKGKVMRTWADNKATKAEAQALDYTRKIDGESAGQAERPESGFDNPRSNVDPNTQYRDIKQAEYSDDEEEDGAVEDDDDDEDESAASSSSSAAAPAKSSGGGFFSYFKTLVSGKVLERSDLEPILAQFKEALNGKNVAAEISEKLAESVIKSLEGKQLASFTTIKSVVRKAIEDALTRILTPNRQIDVLHGVVEANEQKR